MGIVLLKILYHVYEVEKMIKNPNLKDYIAKRIRFLRLKKGYTQEYLAEKANLGFNYIYRLENKHINLTIDTIEKIMIALEVDLNSFFYDNDTENHSDKNIDIIQLIGDIEQLPREKREPTIKALRMLLKQIK